VTIEGTSIVSGDESFTLEPLSECKLHAHGVDVRVALGTEASLSIED
jgi:hypothetical protein